METSYGHTSFKSPPLKELERWEFLRSKSTKTRISTYEQHRGRSPLPLIMGAAPPEDFGNMHSSDVHGYWGLWSNLPGASWEFQLPGFATFAEPDKNGVTEPVSSLLFRNIQTISKAVAVLSP